MSYMVTHMKTADLWRPDELQMSMDKGHHFETYIANLFTLQNYYFLIDEWRTDHSDKRSGIKVGSDSKPDFEIRYKPNNDKFAVECKWRANYFFSQKFHDYVIKWAEPYQIKSYQRFSKKMDMSVFIVIGLGGIPDQPGYIFCLPLAEALYPELFRCILDKYRREPPNKPFFWDTKNKTLI